MSKTGMVCTCMSGNALARALIPASFVRLQIKQLRAHNELIYLSPFCMQVIIYLFCLFLSVFLDF